MYKALCAIAIGLAAYAVTAGSHSANASRGSLVSPIIVAQAKLPHQTAPIPESTMFTPAQDGLFRVSAYATVTKSTSGGSWTFSLKWTDDAGANLEIYALQQSTTSAGQFTSDGGYGGGAVRTFEAKAGTPIMFNLGEAGHPEGGEYSLYYVVEQLE
jgi:hypothetical protein